MAEIRNQTRDFLFQVWSFGQEFNTFSVNKIQNLENICQLLKFGNEIHVLTVINKEIIVNNRSQEIQPLQIKFLEYNTQIENLINQITAELQNQQRCFPPMFRCVCFSTLALQQKQISAAISFGWLIKYFWKIILCKIFNPKEENLDEKLNNQSYQQNKNQKIENQNNEQKAHLKKIHDACSNIQKSLKNLDNQTLIQLWENSAQTQKQQTLKLLQIIKEQLNEDEETRKKFWSGKDFQKIVENCKDKWKEKLEMCTNVTKEIDQILTYIISTEYIQTTDNDFFVSKNNMKFIQGPYK